MSGINPEDPPVDLILQVVDLEVDGPKQPKVLLFDIGGVCVSFVFFLLVLAFLLTCVRSYRHSKLFLTMSWAWASPRAG